MNAILAAIEERGLLLLQDKSLPNAVTVVTGDHPRGSWWSHPRAHEIFRLVEGLDEREVLTAKLIGRKVTFVHRSLWPALFAVGAARERWQMSALSSETRGLLRRIDRGDEVRASRDAVNQIEHRLLARTTEVHTESGRHEKVLSAWPASSMAVAEAKRSLEDAALRLGAPRKLLPWHKTVAAGS